MPFLLPNQQRQGTEGIQTRYSQTGRKMESWWQGLEWKI